LYIKDLRQLHIIQTKTENKKNNKKMIKKFKQNLSYTTNFELLTINFSYITNFNTSFTFIQLQIIIENL
jgi:hypothetical protein